MILSIEGEEKSGKTTLAYTAPLPIVGFSLDMGTERAIYGAKYPEFFDGLKIRTEHYKRGDKPDLNNPAWVGQDITIFEIPMPIQLDNMHLVGNIEAWEYFFLLFYRAIESGVRTIVIDTMTLVRRLKAESYLQELQEGSKGRPRKQLIQIEYGPVNDAIRSIYSHCKNEGVDLIAIHHLTDEYRQTLDSNGMITSAATGNRVLEGLTGTHRNVDVALRLEKIKGQGIVGKMVNCGPNLDLEDIPIANPSWDKIVTMISQSIGGRIDFRKRNGHGGK